MSTTASPESRGDKARRLVREVEAARSDGATTLAALAARDTWWSAEFPALFKVIAAGNYDHRVLDTVLSQFDAVERGTRSQHDASVAVGTVLVERIVKPQLRSGNNPA